MSGDYRDRSRVVFLVAVMMLSVVLASTVFAGSAAAETDSVTLLDGEGNQSGTYSDINTALDNAEENYTIDLKDGDYTLSSEVTTSGLAIEGPNAGVAGDSDDRDDEANVTFQTSISGENVTVDGVQYEEESDRVEIYGANTTLKNTAVEVPSDDAPVRLHADNIVIANNEFDGPGGNWGINSRQDETNLLDGIEVTDNVFRNAGDGVVQAKGWTNALISRNNFSDLDADAVRLAYNVTGTEVTNNVIRNTGQNPDNLLTTGIFLNSVEGEIEISGNGFEDNPYHIAVFGNSDEPVIQNNEFDKRVDVIESNAADDYIAGEIQAAVDDAAEGTTVEVGPGTYNESVTISTANVTLESTGGADATTIDLTGTEDPGKAIAATAVKITAPGVTVDGFNIVGGTYAGTGVSVQVNTAPSGVAITNNTISGFAGEAGGDKKESFGILAWGTDTALENITIRGNTIEDIGSGTNGADTNSQGFGIFLEELADKTDGHKGATIQKNTIRNINGTKISGNNNYPGVGVSLLPELTNPDASTSDSGIVTDTPNADLHNNTITSNAVGVSIAGNASQTAVTSNDLSSNGIGVLTEGNVPDDGSVGITEIDAESTDSVVSGTVDATSNWWGSANGPAANTNTYNNTSQGTAVSGSVEFTPWLNASINNDGQAFAPVTNNSGGEFASIQAAVDAADTGETIEVEPGTYVEEVEIDKPLTLESEGIAAETSIRRTKE